MKIAVVMGSKSDLPKLESGIKFIKSYGIEVVVRILSAHRTPEELTRFFGRNQGQYRCNNRSGR